MKITIPIINVDLFILIGKDGLNEFKKEVNKDNSEWIPDSKMKGYAAENYVCIYKYDRVVLIHELIHFLDWLYEYLACKNESEFKAYLGEYVISTVLKKFNK